MLLATALIVQMLAGGTDTTSRGSAIRFVPPVAPTASYLSITAPGPDAPMIDDTIRPRARAVTYSEWYARRLTIHQWASWTMLPLSVGEYVVGQKLYRDSAGADQGLRDTHKLLASGIEGLFALNTVTGAWNLWDSRHDPAGRTRRWVHGISMLVADVGFLAASATGPGDDCRENGGVCPPNAQRAGTHRTIAIGAFGLSTASWLMMLLWKN
jgi:hypothetical protein